MLDRKGGESPRQSLSWNITEHKGELIMNWAEIKLVHYSKWEIQLHLLFLITFVSGLVSNNLEILI